LGRFSVRGVKKEKKVYVESFSQQNRQKFRCEFFLGFFGLSRFWLFVYCVSKTQQNPFYKKNVLKKFCQKIQNRCFLEYFHHVFGRFSVRREERVAKCRRWSAAPCTHPPSLAVRQLQSCFEFAEVFP
jgi:hypothetical protein